MKSFGKFYRLIYINYILAKHGFDEIILATRWFAPLSFLSYMNPWYWIQNRHKARSERLLLTLEDLGPIFVKFGQMLSTRRDLLPEDFADALTRLQDKVKPFEGAQEIIENALGDRVENIFTFFDPVALASASIAQVHAASLPNGLEVVIKVKRPGIETIIQRDIDLLYIFARLIEKYTTFGQRIRAIEVIQEFERTILYELDLMREAANAAILKKNFKGSKKLYIPEVYWSYCRENILVIERIYGIPISDIATLKLHHINLEKLAKNAVEIFFTQVFRDCFFHGDMHPGNLFVNPLTPDDPQYIAIDFGIMGSLTSSDQRYLAENLLAFFNRDYRRVAELHLASGWIPKDTSIQAFESAIRTVCEPIFQKQLKEISFGQLLLRLFQTGKEFHMEIQPQLLLLQKTLVHIEGLGRVLCPDIDLWASAQPIVEKWMKQQFGVGSLIRKVKNNLPYWLEHLPEIPELIYKKLKDESETKTQDIVLAEFHRERPSRCLAALGFCCIIISIILFMLTQSQFASFINYRYFCFALGGVGVVGVLMHWTLKKLSRL